MLLHRWIKYWVIDLQRCHWWRTLFLFCFLFCSHSLFMWVVAEMIRVKLEQFTQLRISEYIGLHNWSKSIWIFMLNVVRMTIAKHCLRDIWQWPTERTHFMCLCPSLSVHTELQCCVQAVQLWAPQPKLGLTHRGVLLLDRGFVWQTHTHLATAVETQHKSPGNGLSSLTTM